METTEIEKQNGQLQHATPDQLLSMAVENNLDIDKLAKLMDLQERWEAGKARKDFFQALSDFQSECPELRKTKEVSFATSTGHTKYSYAPLADIDRQIKKPLKDNGLSKRWEIQDEGEDIAVTCFITHLNGHTEKTSMRSKPDGSGSKNPIQARGSAIEYMKRYTLIGALGLTTADTDIDGRMPELDIDKLHRDFMVLYNQLIQIDPSYSKYHVDNWKGEVTGKNYVRAIGELRKILVTIKSAQV